MIGSAGLRYISRAEISDGHGGKKEVKKGDKVNLLPFESTEADGTEKDYTAKVSYDSQREWLGKGPFSIDKIGLWPCGRVMLYIRTATSSGSGVYAKDMMAV